MPSGPPLASNRGPNGNALGAFPLSEQMVATLPKSASPQVNDAFDAVALASHAAMLAVGFRLIGLGEDDKIEAPADTSESPRLPSKWNALKGSYAFRYKHSQSSIEYLLKVNSKGKKAVIMGMGVGDDRTYTFDVKVHEFVSDGNLPATPFTDGISESEAGRKIIDVFISIGRLSDLGCLMRLNIVQ